MAKRLRNVVMYGSGINPEETAFSLEQMIPVTVDGFRRRFNQRTVWRGAEDGKEGVLNVERDDAGWINGVLMTEIDEDAGERLAEREKGYHFVEVSKDAITPYRDDDRNRVADAEEIVIAVGDRVDPSLEPIPSYVELCMEGARFWDERAPGFYQDFLATTENDGKSLRDYL